MRKVLRKYINQEIGINFEKAFKIEPARLLSVNKNHFTIKDEKTNHIHHFTYQSIVQVIEHDGGVDIHGLFTHKLHFNVIIKVGHLFEYAPP